MSWREVPIHLEAGSNRLGRRKVKVTAWQVLEEVHVSVGARVHVHVADRKGEPTH